MPIVIEEIKKETFVDYGYKESMLVFVNMV